MTTLTADLNKRTMQYVALRDQIAKEDEDHKNKMAPYRELLKDLNSWLHGQLQAQNVESISTESGTVYRTTKKSASIADGEIFWDYVVKNQAFDLIDKRANAVAVEEFITKNSTPPPGINYTTAEVVGVRRK